MAYGAGRRATGGSSSPSASGPESSTPACFGRVPRYDELAERRSVTVAVFQ